MKFTYPFTVKLTKPWTPEIFMERYCVARNEPIRREITKPKTATVISLWFWGLLGYPEFHCNWPVHNQRSWNIFRFSRFSEFDSKLPRICSLSHCSLWVWARPEGRWDLLTCARGTSSCLYGCSNKLTGSYRILYDSLGYVAFILRRARHLTSGILTNYADVLNFKTLDACCLLDSCKTNDSNKYYCSFKLFLPFLIPRAHSL